MKLKNINTKMTRDIDIKNATDEQLVTWFNDNSGSKPKATLGDRATAEAKCAELKQALIDLASGSSKTAAKGKPAKGKPAKGAKKSAVKKTGDVKVSGGKSEARGRNSSHAGKKIFILTEKNANPRREGTHGHKSFELVRTAGSGKLTYEAYIEKGGRSNDLAWDLDKGYVKVQ